MLNQNERIGLMNLCVNLTDVAMFHDRISVTIHRVSDVGYYQLIPYFGKKEGGEGRLFGVHQGIVGLACRTSETILESGVETEMISDRVSILRQSQSSYAAIWLNEQYILYCEIDSTLTPEDIEVLMSYEMSMS